MAKLPKSSRPGRRKASDTFNHNYQQNLFDPTPASLMREIGWSLQTVGTLLGGLFVYYMTTAQPYPDDSSVKAQLHYGALAVFCGAAFIGIVELLRRNGWFDTTKGGKIPAYALGTVAAVGGGFLLLAGYQVWALQHYPYQRRLLEQQATRAAVEDCKSKKAVDLEAANKKRASSRNELAKCSSEFEKKLKPLFSQETAAIACKNQQASAERADREYRAVDGRKCEAAKL